MKADMISSVPILYTHNEFLAKVVQLWLYGIGLRQFLSKFEGSETRIFLYSAVAASRDFRCTGQYHWLHDVFLQPTSACFDFSSLGEIRCRMGLGASHTLPLHCMMMSALSTSCAFSPYRTHRVPENERVHYISRENMACNVFHFNLLKSSK